MALEIGTNSFVTEEAADSYFVNRVHNEQWDANPDIQEEALITASGILNLENWEGMTRTAEQPMAFPRSGRVTNTRSGWDINLETVEIPQQVVSASCELALHLINNPDLLEDTGDTESLKVGSISLVSTTKAEKVPSYIKSMYRELLVGGGTRRVF
jgi:hypothetical protein